MLPMRAYGWAPTKPTLNLDFVNNTTLDAAVTFTRALNTATYFNSAGVLTTANANVARFDYDPATLAPRGLLIEEARTNLLLNSATLSTQSVTVSATAYTLSFYGTGTVTLSGTSTAGPLVGSGAFPTRSTLTFTPTAGTLTLTVTGTVQYAQLEAGAFATSYIPTTGSSATRNADDVSITTVTPWFNAPAGTFASSFFRPVSTATNNTIFRIDDGTANNRHMEWIAASGAVAALHSLTGTLTTGPTTANTVTLAATNKAAYTYDASGVTVCLNAGTVPADNTSNIPTGATMTRMFIGANSAGSNYLNGHIRSLSFYPRRLSNAELQAITS